MKHSKANNYTMFFRLVTVSWILLLGTLPFTESRGSESSWTRKNVRIVPSSQSTSTSNGNTNTNTQSINLTSSKNSNTINYTSNYRGAPSSSSSSSLSSSKTTTNNNNSRRKSIFEPVALVSISDIQSLQSEIHRLKQIIHEKEVKEEQKRQQHCIRQRLKRLVGGGSKITMNQIHHPHSQKEEEKEQQQKLVTMEQEQQPQQNENDNQDIVCSYINHILVGRLEQVMNKKRSKDFTIRYKKHLDAIDGEFTIVSLHGREHEEYGERDDSNSDCDSGRDSEMLIDETIDKKEQTNNDIASTQKVQLISDENDHQELLPTISSSSSSIFPNDLQSLDMVYTTPIYTIAKTQIDTKLQNEKMDHHTMYTKEVLFVPKLVLRAMQLGLNFVPVTMSLGLAAWSKNFRENVWYGLVGRCLAKSGPAFIKWGQWASTRPDVFPDALCQVLSELHADAPAHSWTITQNIVEEALCIPKGSLYQVFDEFDPNPVASGSIAQVHRAVLKQLSNNSSSHYNKKNKNKTQNHDDNNKKGIQVAVKVRHPNVSRLIDMDFRLMAMVANIADKFPALSWLRIKDSVEQFSHTMAAQAHLNVEAHHLEVLNHNFRKWETVQFPRPIFACSSVIIETFERGEICSNIIDKYDSLALTKSTRSGVVGSGKESGHELMPVPLSKFIVTTGLSLYLKMLLVDNLMHADLHPGNILLDCQIYGDDHQGDTSPLGDLVNVPVGGAEVATTVSSRSSKRVTKRQKKKTAIAPKVEDGFYGQVTLVDAGMVAQLDNNESTNYIGLISALGEGDGRAAAEAILKFKSDGNASSDLSAEEKEAFTIDIIELFEERCRGYGTNVDFGNVLRGVLGIVRKHHVQLGANYATLVVNSLCLDGLAKRVCPTYNLLDASKPLLRAYRALPNDNGENNVEKKAFLAGRPKLRRSIIRAATPVLYMRKHFEDNRFFKKIEERRKRNKMIIRKHDRVKRLKNSVLFVGKRFSRVFLVGLVGLLLHHSASNLTVGGNDDDKSSMQTNEAVTPPNIDIIRRIMKTLGEKN